MHHNQATPIADHENRQKSDKLMDIYYVVEVIVIPYPWFGVVDNDKFLHAPTYTYNKVMQLLGFVGVVDH